MLFGAYYLMPHLWCTGVRTLGDQWNSESLVAMIAVDFHGIFVGVFDLRFFDPKKQPAFRAFPHKHRHNVFSNVGW